MAGVDHVDRTVHVDIDAVRTIRMDHVSVAGLQGTVREVGPVATVIDTDDHGVTERHTIPNTKMLNEAVR